MRAVFCIVTVLVLILTSALLSSQPTSAQAIKLPTMAELAKDGLKPLTGQQIKDIFTDATVYYANMASPIKIAFYYRNDGTRSAIFRNKRFNGKWWIKDDQRCEESIRGGEICSRVFKDGNSYYNCPVGKDVCEHEMTILKGNKENL